MNILAFEAADFGLSIALMVDDQIVDLYCSDNLFTQDSLLLPVIERMMTAHKINYSDLQLIATTQGPGSFTGIRMTLATAVGLSLATNIPAVAFDSFYWIAASYLTIHHSKHPILVALESKRQDIYCQLFDAQGKPLKEPQALLPEEIYSYCNQLEFICIGSGCAKALEGNGKNLIQAEPFPIPQADTLCTYAHQQTIKHGVTSFPCKPFYLSQPAITLTKT